MKKNILSTICIALLTTLCVNNVSSESKTAWELLWHFNIYEVQGSHGHYSPLMWEDNLYTSKWDGLVYEHSIIQKYERNGNEWTYIGDIQITGLTPSPRNNIGGFCTDGQYIYGCYGTNAIFQINPNDWEVASTIIVSGQTIDCLAYDEDQDGFWISSMSGYQASFVTRAGTVTKTLTTSFRISDLAWEKYSDGIPYLWMMTFDNFFLHRWNLTNDEFTPNAKSLSDVPNLPILSGGGLFTGIDPVLKKNVLIGLFEMNIIFCYDLGNSEVFTDGDGSENNPYIITTTEQLAQLAKFVNNGSHYYNDKHYKLGNDIDISDYLGYEGTTTANAGSSRERCANADGQYTFNMYANQPNLNKYEKGKWEIVTSPAPNGVHIADDTNPFTQITVKAGVSVELSWTIYSEFCEPSTDTITLTAWKLPVATLQNSYSVLVGNELRIEAVVTNGLPPYAYNWYPSVGIYGTSDNQYFHVNTSEPTQGYISVRVYDDNNCYVDSNLASVTISSYKSGNSNDIENISTDCNPIETIDLDRNDTLQNQKSTITINNDKNINRVQTERCRGWIPIGTDSQPFKGVFDGDGYKISGLYFLNSEFDNAGLFGHVDGGTIKNLIVDDIEVKGKNNVGGIVGYLLNSSISNCYSTGKVAGNNRVGGLVGWHNESVISNCYSECNVSGNEMVGGIAGWLDLSSITTCYSTGEIYGNSSIGGISGGINNNSAISDCVSLNSSIKGTDSDVGRIAGINNNTLSNNAAFAGIINNAGNTTWNNIGEDQTDGANISKETILSDGALGNRFSAPVWTVQNGKLPGLFGFAVNMPEHLSPTPLVITTTTMPYGQVGDEYYHTLTATGDLPITWSITSGNLPTGLSLSATSGTILGVPSIRGTFSFIVTITNIYGNASKQLAITIAEPGYPLIITTSLPTGTPEELYSAQLEVLSETPVTWAIISGALPPVLNLSTITGLIAGIPNVEGTFNFIVQATNSLGNDTRELSITIGTSGIEELRIKNYELRVFPNPTDGQLRITNYELRDDVIIEIYDMTGRPVGAYGIRPDGTINISHLPNGLYMLKIANETIKIVKQ